MCTKLIYVVDDPGIYFELSAIVIADIYHGLVLDSVELECSNRLTFVFDS